MGGVRLNSCFNKLTTISIYKQIVNEKILMDTK